jgi:hypothetical protein
MDEKKPVQDNVIQFPKAKGKGKKRSFKDAVSEQKVQEESREYKPKDALREAENAELDEILIVGMTNSGKMFYTTSAKNAFSALFLTEYAKFTLTHRMMKPDV